jgi:hypothetical protein
MAERRERVSLALESLEVFRIVREIVMEDL